MLRLIKAIFVPSREELERKKQKLDQLIESECMFRRDLIANRASRTYHVQRWLTESEERSIRFIAERDALMKRIKKLDQPALAAAA